MLKLTQLPNGEDSPFLNTDPAPGATFEAELIERHMDVLIMKIEGVISCGAIVRPDTPAGIVVSIDRTHPSIGKTMYWITSLLDTLQNPPTTVEFIERDPPPMLLKQTSFVPFLQAMRGMTGIHAISLRIADVQTGYSTILSITLDPNTPDHPALYAEITKRLRALKNPPKITSIRCADMPVSAEMTLPPQALPEEEAM
jgi:hypothetical protein